MVYFEPYQLVEVTPGHWKRLCDLSQDEAAQMAALARHSQGLRRELDDMLRRWGDAIRAEPELAAGGIPGEVSEMGNPHEMSYLRAQRAVDAMRAHLAALGLGAGRDA